MQPGQLIHVIAPQAARDKQMLAAHGALWVVSYVVRMPERRQPGLAAIPAMVRVRAKSLATGESYVWDAGEYEACPSSDS